MLMGLWNIFEMVVILYVKIKIYIISIIYKKMIFFFRKNLTFVIQL